MTKKLNIASVMACVALLVVLGPGLARAERPKRDQFTGIYGVNMEQRHKIACAIRENYGPDAERAAFFGSRLTGKTVTKGRVRAGSDLNVAILANAALDSAAEKQMIESLNKITGLVVQLHHVDANSEGGKAWQEKQVLPFTTPSGERIDIPFGGPRPVAREFPLPRHRGRGSTSGEAPTAAGGTDNHRGSKEHQVYDNPSFP